MIDPDGYRPNVGIILIRRDAKVLWARRISRDGWQFPQGGMNSDETPIEAMYRELHEEVGLADSDVRVLGSTPGWLRYRLPRRCIRHHERPTCVGQKQVWFLLELLCDEARIRFDLTDSPEFSEFRWVDFWYPLQAVVSFKRDVYTKALAALQPLAEGCSGRSLGRPDLGACTGTRPRGFQRASLARM
ncbi:RNA pyrophosphohydrolase [Pseudomarimonas salicorniae]|uniref:RNA pyrophosphohydrolase n=1 Tax=Pseudomarimonas salicorniae TaxID=2933270 RepID=A0ABT0GGD9_9GAMM|nr:RNA pyrophosphohydrolase [Lysobacter sp. CAU 1642]